MVDRFDRDAHTLQHGLDVVFQRGRGGTVTGGAPARELAGSESGVDAAEERIAATSTG